jgi:SAM-dependent methyltransferase
MLIVHAYMHGTNGRVERVNRLAWDTSPEMQRTKTRFLNQAKSSTFNNIIGHFGLDRYAVLDIGCTNGEMLCHFGTGSVGITINKEEADLGRKIGLDVRPGNIESPDFSLAEKFKFIYCGNLLEHLFSPHEFLVKIRKNLDDNGCLILGVPVFPQITSLLRIRRFRGALADAHINFYTANTLMQTVERAGWNISEARSFHFSNGMADRMIRALTPMLYVVAKPAEEFGYSEKRLKELKGYETE